MQAMGVAAAVDLVEFDDNETGLELDDGKVDLDDDETGFEVDYDKVDLEVDDDDEVFVVVALISYRQYVSKT